MGSLVRSVETLPVIPDATDHPFVSLKVLEWGYP